MFVVRMYRLDWGMTVYLMLNGPFEYIKWTAQSGEATALPRSKAEQYRMICGDEAEVIRVA